MAHLSLFYGMKLRRPLILLFLLLVLLLAGFLYALPLLRTGAGYAAKMTCSCHYLENGEQSLAEIQANRLNFSVLGKVRLKHDEASQSFTGSFWGVAKRKVQYVPGRGCIVVSDPHLALPPPYTPPVAPLTQIASDLPLRPDSTTQLGINMEQLEQAVDFGMQAVPGGGAHAIVVLRNGKLLTERYAPGITADSRLLGWSMTKSLTGALVGMRIQEGAIDLEQLPVLPEWAGTADQPDPRAEIKLKDLLQMNSGLKWVEEYGGVTDATIMLYDQANMAAYASKQAQAHPPGTEWVYSSGTSNLLMGLVANTFPQQTDFLDWMYTSLFQAIGANSFIIETDQSGCPVGSSYAWARARDWAKMGQLFLQDGRWNDKQVIPAGWVDYLRQPAAGSAGTYGGQIWLNDPEMPSLPNDAFAFRGFQDQRVFILPSQDLVVVRLGHNEDKVADFDGLIARILAAQPTSSTGQ